MYLGCLKTKKQIKNALFRKGGENNRRRACVAQFTQSLKSKSQIKQNMTTITISDGCRCEALV
jgi:hypothetical protein